MIVLDSFQIYVSAVIFSCTRSLPHQLISGRLLPVIFSRFSWSCVLRLGSGVCVCPVELACLRIKAGTRLSPMKWVQTWALSITYDDRYLISRFCFPEYVTMLVVAFYISASGWYVSPSCISLGMLGLLYLVSEKKFNMKDFTICSAPLSQLFSFLLQWKSFSLLHVHMKQIWAGILCIS